ncbi:hypothetical protein I4F81_011395 [Pyropia yezoensis]|uniref:Uncharacterized protein n=1 Tax=Pyropia yezoensis TaxID=2788 RepID=A0ACC3CFQ2_PYRYE|nr:hypothetical protein I4F81_011395 [Neopyropia yezoensis]
MRPQMTRATALAAWTVGVWIAAATAAAAVASVAAVAAPSVAAPIATTALLRGASPPAVPARSLSSAAGATAIGRSPPDVEFRSQRGVLSQEAEAVRHEPSAEHWLTADREGGGSRQAVSTVPDGPDDLRQRIAGVLAAPLVASGAGVSYAIAQRGALVVADARGLASIELGVLMDATTRTDVASVSKKVTAFLLYWLDDASRLALVDDVRKYVPELLIKAAGPITLRHMVHHVSGLPEAYTSFFLARGGLGDAIPRRVLLAAIYRLKELRFAPGSAWEYSNTNFILAGLVAERVMAKPLRLLLADIIFRPLRMAATDLYDSTERVYPDIASSYTINASAAAVPGEALDISIARESHRLTPVGSSGIVTTPTDLLRWLDNFSNNTLGGGQSLIYDVTAPYVLRDAAGDVVPPTYAFGAAYGAGLFVSDLPVAGANTTVRVVHHSGIIAGYRSIVAWVPDAEITLALQATSAVFSDTFFFFAAAIAAVAFPDEFGVAPAGQGGRGGGAQPLSPVPSLSVPFTDEVTDSRPSGAISAPAASLADVAGVWSLDVEVSPFGAFELQAGGNAPRNDDYSSPRAYGYDSGNPPDGNAAEWLFLDFGRLTRSQLFPVSTTRFVGALNGVPGALTLEVSPPLNRSAPAIATLTIASLEQQRTLRATRYPSLQLTAAVLDAAAGTYTSARLGATYTSTPRGGGLGVAIHGDEGRLGSTFLPCCATPGGDWNGTFSSGRPGIPATSELRERYLLLTAAFDGDSMGLDVRIANGGQEDLDGVPFSRVGTCPV